MENILHEVQAVYKKNPAVKEIKIKSSIDLAVFAKSIFPVDINHREAMIVIFLNRFNITTGYSIISTGGISGTVVDPKILFQMALINNCSAFFMVHNHPSGNLKPSEMDKKLTNRIKKGAKILDIILLDHIIITEEEHYSFADNGLL